MAFVGSAALLGVIGTGVQAYGANAAAKAQQKGNNAAIAEQRRQFDLIMQMLGPQQQFGVNSLNTLNRLNGYGPISGGGVPGQQGYGQGNGSQIGSGGYGIDPNTGGVTRGIGGPQGNGLGDVQPSFWPRAVGSVLNGTAGGGAGAGSAPGASQFGPQTQGSPDLSVFFNSPDYQFRRNEGQRGIENSFSARGGAQSGNALRALSEFNSNLASGEFGNFYNRLLAGAGLGQAANQQAGYSALNSGNNIGNMLAGNGQSRASGITNQTNSLTDLLGSLVKFGGYGG